MSKSILYAANLESQTVAAGGQINFGQAVRKTESGLSLYGGNVTEKGAGYYTHLASIGFTAGATGTATITFYKNGVAIPGAVAVLTTTVSEQYQACVPFATREACCLEGQITAVVTGQSVTVTDATILSERI